MDCISPQGLIETGSVLQLVFNSKVNQNIIFSLLILDS